METVSGPQPTATVVLINDNPFQLRLLESTLRKAGFHPTTFSNAVEALQELGKLDLPDLIITDLYMPQIDGWRFCRLLRSAEFSRFNLVPILIVSATYTGEEAARITEEVGADGFLGLPVDPDSLISKVRSLLTAQPHIRMPRALIVEDSKTLAGFLKRAMEDHGYTADTALSGEEAELRFNIAPPDVVILDYHLPDVLGDVLLVKFKKIRPDCVVLMMTNDPRPELALEWMKNGAAAYLRKPFETDYLIRLCEGARRERALLRVEDLLEERTAQLKESEERFRLVVENAPDAIYIARNYRFAYANPAALKLFGASSQTDLIGKPVMERLHPESRDVIQRRIKELNRGRRSVPLLEEKYLTLDGAEVDVEVSAVSLDFEGQKGTMAFVRNITERKRAEAETAKAKDLFRNLFHLSPIPSSFTRLKDGTLIDLNQAFADTVGYPREQLLGRPATDFGLWADPELRRHVIETVVAKGSLRGREMKFVTSSGQEGYALGYFELFEIDSERYILSNLLDITDRKRAEEDLRDSEAILNDAQEIAGMGSYRWDVKSDTLEFSRNMFALAGRKPGEISARLFENMRELVHPDDFPRMQEEIRQMIEQQRNWPVEFRIVLPDGEERIWQSQSRFEFDDEGNPVKCIGLHLDVTEQRRREATQKHLETQLRQAQKLESVGRLAGGVAHDFNNMLGVILGHAQIGLLEADSEPHLKSHLTEIRRAAERSAGLTRQLLAFARKQTVRPIRLDVNSTVMGMFEMLRRLIGEDVELEWKPAADLWNVSIDPSQMDQLLANLAVNARDAIGGVGKVTIESSNVLLDETYGADHAEFVPGRYVMLGFSDDGCGMDEETLARVFEPFFTTKDIGRGTGLGLATVYGIVRQNDGFINVYSEPGIGTTFKIYLPAVEDQPVDAIPESKEQVLQGGFETVLIVEDEEMILSLTKAMLERLGYTVFTSRTPKKAVELAASHEGPIHLLITDVVMPEMNGRQLARALTALKAEMKCLFMSGYTNNVIADRGILEEGVHFLQKPFTIEILADKVRQALKGSEPDASLPPDGKSP